MYLQISSKCNMTCAHCCFAATNRGVNMDRYTFITALDMAADMGELITIGGGEPTVHPEFFVFLDKAMEYYDRGRIEMPPLVVTNGKLTGKARKLLQYVEEERPVYVDLSQDEYHDPIHPDIVAAFQAHQRRNEQIRRGYGYSGQVRSDGRGAGIRTVTEIRPVGRAAEAARGIITSKVMECCCEDPLVSPEGLIYSCGCKTHLLGSVFEGCDVLDGYDREYAHSGGGLPARDMASVMPHLPMAA